MHQTLFFLTDASAAEFDNWNGLWTTDTNTLGPISDHIRVGRSQASSLGLALFELAYQLSVAFWVSESVVRASSDFCTHFVNNESRNRPPETRVAVYQGHKRKEGMSSRIRDVLSLALCHNVCILSTLFSNKPSHRLLGYPVTDDDGMVTYQASSPDEVAEVANCVFDDILSRVFG